METRGIYQILQRHGNWDVGRDLEESRWGNGNTKRRRMTQLAYFSRVLEY